MLIYKFVNVKENHKIFCFEYNILIKKEYCIFFYMACVLIWYRIIYFTIIANKSLPINYSISHKFNL